MAGQDQPITSTNLGAPRPHPGRQLRPPGVTAGKASISFPVKVGLSAKDYYEFGTGEDSSFGYFSAAGVVTVPVSSHWNVHGGAEFQSYGENLKVYNGYGDDGDRPYTGIASIGLGFSF